MGEHNLPAKGEDQNRGDDSSVATDQTRWNRYDNNRESSMNWAEKQPKLPQNIGGMDTVKIFNAERLRSGKNLLLEISRRNKNDFDHDCHDSQFNYHRIATPCHLNHEQTHPELR